MKRILAALLCALILLNTTAASADDYQVSASVPYDPPITAPQIITPADGTIVTATTLAVEGTCQYNASGYVVSLWRSGLNIGGGLCQAGGTFSIVVSLTDGANVITPRSSTLLGAYGPDGTAVRVSYTAPKPTPENPAPGPSPVPPKVPGPVDQGGLAVTSPQPFALIGTDSNTVTIEIVIQGGATPYTLTLNWGDGSTETKTLPAGGTYRFSHRYEQPSIYTVRASVTDVLGVTTEYRLPVVSTSKLVEQTGAEQQTNPKTGRSIRSDVVWLVCLIILVVISTFWLGSRYQRERIARDYRIIKRKRRKS